MSSYALLCKKAGLPAPTGLANYAIPRTVRRRPRPSAAAEKEALRVNLEAMVSRGELAKTPDGRYFLPT